MAANHYSLQLAGLMIYAINITIVSTSLVPRPPPDFISQLWRKLNFFLHGCERKSGSGLGMRLSKHSVPMFPYHNNQWRSYDLQYDHMMADTQKFAQAAINADTDIIHIIIHIPKLHNWTWSRMLECKSRARVQTGVWGTYRYSSSVRL